MHRRGKKAVVPADMGLNMECNDEDLSPAQLAFYGKGELEFKEISSKLETLIKNCGAEIVEKESEDVFVLQVNSPVGPAAPPLASLTPSTPITTQNLKSSVITRQQGSVAGTQVLQTKSNSVLLQNQAQPALRSSNSTYQLVMDPRSGLIVGVNTPPSIPPPLQKTSTPQQKTAAPLQKAQPPKQTTVLKQPMTPRAAAPTRTMPVRNVPKVAPPMVAIPGKGITALPAPPQGARGRGRGAGQGQLVVNTKPTENNSVGGLIAGGSKLWKPTVAPVVDLTSDDPSRPTNVADSREVMFSKLSGKTFPSLVVVARPYLRLKDLGQAAISQGRDTLDAKVKSTLMFTPTKFTEWLIQQGYVRSEQCCSSHLTPERTPVKLKLGMYSDVSKFPYSGGYVWISECCPHRFVSVFSGSIFEGAPHPPTVLLKLLYHWSCQTNVQNVVQWVKVDNFYVKNFFTNMRAICTSAVHEKYEKMGGRGKHVEVGVISLGTTSQDGNMRQVKVEVLGVMEPESKLVRLRAVEPLLDGEKNYKRRFVKILEPLEQWVDKSSTILTDFTVDKGTLHAMGYSSVYQVSPTGDKSAAGKYTNGSVMEYLRRIVPRMFQNTLSLLSRQIIQQFLDELVWRERWGPIPSQCFENILLHLSEQTKLESGDSLLTRLSRVSSNPFLQWSYKAITTGNQQPRAAAKANGPSPAAARAPAPVVSGIDMLPASIRTIDPPPLAAPAKRSRKRGSLEPQAAGNVKRQATELKTSLESYYYGTMEGDPNIIKKEVKNTSPVKCCICPRKYSNNVQLMVHLIFHAEAEEMVVSPSSENVLCRYCLKSFPSSWQLKQHIEKEHARADSAQVMCRICDQVFPERTSLIAHMHRLHSSTELPYECSICTYRSSLHRDVIDHFYSTHDGGENLQCPLCLKVVAYNSGGRVVDSNLMFFLTHVQKHFRQTAARRCAKCVLVFVHKGMLKDHEREHRSFAGQPGVRVFVQTNGSDCIMTLPGASPTVAAPTRQRSMHSVVKFDHLRLLVADERCNECGSLMMDPEHFPGLVKCTKCRYVTCCLRAMPDHVRRFHSRLQSVEKASLPNLMHCVCGFKSRMGNQLAKHMALCERKTAYVSMKRAQLSTRAAAGSASFPPLVTLDDGGAAGEDATDRWLKAFAPARIDSSETNKPAASGPPSMLNMLGLVRRSSSEEPPEPESKAEPDAKPADSKEDSTLPDEAEAKGEVMEEIASVEAGEEDKPEIDASDAPMVDPIAADAPSVEPIATDVSIDEPIAIDAPSVEPIADDTPVVEPLADNAPLIEPVETDVLVEPILADIPSIEPIDADIPLLEPIVSDDFPLLEPIAADAAFVEPALADIPLVEPVEELLASVGDPESMEVLPMEPEAEKCDPIASGDQEKMDID